MSNSWSEYYEDNYNFHEYMEWLKEVRRMVRALNTKQVQWAWQKRSEGHTVKQIADALYCHPQTLDRHLRVRYGKTRPEKLIPLVYEEEE